MHPAEPGELRAIRGRIEFWGRRQGLTAETLVDLQLAVGEAVSNGIDHAYLDGRNERRRIVEVELELRMTRAGRAVEVRVADRGRWRPAPAEPEYRGRGLALIEALSNDLQVQRTAEGTQLRFAIPMAA